MPSSFPVFPDAHIQTQFPTQSHCCTPDTSGVPAHDASASSPASDSTNSWEKCFRIKLRNPSNSGGAHSLLSSYVDTAGAVEVEFRTKASMVNAITAAHTSTGYPTHAKTTSGRGSVYGAFVERRSPSLRSLTFPPSETLIIANAAPNASATAPYGAATYSSAAKPLLRVVWRRGSHLFATEAAQAVSFVDPANTPSGFVLPKAIDSSSLQRIREYPDGIHKVDTSLRLQEMLLDLAPDSSQSSASFNNAVDTTHDVGDSKKQNDDKTERDDAAENIGSDSAAGGVNSKDKPPLKETPVEGIPVQLTLLVASTFSHLTTYAVRHQEGKLLEVVPLQTVLASLSTRRVTAQCPFLLGINVSKTYVAPGLPADTPQNVLPDEGGKTMKKSCNTVFPNTKASVPSPRHSATMEEGSTLHMEEIKTERGIENNNASSNTTTTTTTSVVTQYVAVEPFILIGNQNGDILLLSIFKGKIVQHLNFSGGVNNGNGTEGSNGVGKKFIHSSVSCITEVECGIEKRLMHYMDVARLCKPAGGGGKSFINSSVLTQKQGDFPSIFAVGFDNGHVILISVTLEKVCITKHISMAGDRPVQVIAMQVPHFFTRLWPNDIPPFSPASWTPCEVQKEEEERERKKVCDPVSRICVTADSLVVDEDKNFVAVSCDGGTLRLVKAPSMEVEICRVTAIESNTVGDFLAVQWVPSCAGATMYPNLLVVTNEDDSMTVYQLSHLRCGGVSATSTLVGGQGATDLHDDSGLFSPLANGQSLSAYSQAVKEGFEVMARRLFHRSWVADLCALPLSKGYLLVATSYDGRSSFWPFSGSDPAPSAENHASPPFNSLESFLHECFTGCFIQDVSISSATSRRVVDEVIPVKPADAVALHADPTVRCIAGGAGRSHFFVSLCLRGRLKFWEVESISN